MGRRRQCRLTVSQHSARRDQRIRGLFRMYVKIGHSVFRDVTKRGSPPQPQRRCLPITQAAQGQSPPSGGQRWLRQAAATGRW